MVASCTYLWSDVMCYYSAKFPLCLNLLCHSIPTHNQYYPPAPTSPHMFLLGRNVLCYPVSCWFWTKPSPGKRRLSVEATYVTCSPLSCLLGNFTLWLHLALHPLSLVCLNITPGLLFPFWSSSFCVCLCVSECTFVRLCVYTGLWRRAGGFWVF